MASPNKNDAEFLIANAERVQVKPSSRLQIANEYYKQGLAGTSESLFLRKAVAIRLSEALAFLPPDYGFVLFDAYRSIETQWAIWNIMYAAIKEQNPSWSDSEVYQETRKFASNPSEKTRFAVSPHNSGGAIDIGLTDSSRTILEMGSSFDELSEKSATAYFERENDCVFRQRRQILCQALHKAGFTNYPEEWWHFDLGSCLWAQEVKSNWFYPSMETTESKA